MNELRKLVFILGLCLLANQGFCQEQFYVFIQSQDHQPFYARTGSTIIRSSGNGYLVIPQLTTGSYEVVIGVPESKPAEWSFHFNVNKEDLGFVLRDKGKNNIVLAALDKKDEIRGVTVKPKEAQKEVSEPVTGIVSDDPFSTMLAGAVNDPTIRQKLVIIEKKEPVPEEKKVQTTPEEIKAEPVPEIKGTVKAQSLPETDKETTRKDIPQKQEPVKTVPEEKKSNTVSAKPDVKNDEPFVIKEVIARADNKEAAKPSKNEVKEVTREEVKAETKVETKSEAKAEDDVKYLPFVITPDEKQPAEKKIIPAEPTDIKVDEKKADQREDLEISTPVEEKKKPQKDSSKKSLLSSVKKTLERRSRDGTDIIYVVENADGEKDTIRIFIPSTK